MKDRANKLVQFLEKGCERRVTALNQERHNLKRVLSRLGQDPKIKWTVHAHSLWTDQGGESIEASSTVSLERTFEVAARKFGKANGNEPGFYQCRVSVLAVVGPMSFIVPKEFWKDLERKHSKDN